LRISDGKREEREAASLDLPVPVAPMMAMSGVVEEDMATEPGRVRSMNKVPSAL